MLGEMLENLQHEVGEPRCDEGAYGDALEGEDADHGADDECRDDIRGSLEQGDAAASGDGGKESGADGDDAELGLERLDHGMDRDGACGDGDEDGRCQDDDAPVESLGAQSVEGGGESQELEYQNDSNGIDHRHVMSHKAQEQDGDEGDVFSRQGGILLCGNFYLDVVHYALVDEKARILVRRIGRGQVPSKSVRFRSASFMVKK